jgi:hypothetical protein
MLPILASVASSLLSGNKKDSKEEPKERTGKGLANRIFNRNSPDKNKPIDDTGSGRGGAIIKAPTLGIKKITSQAFGQSSSAQGDQLSSKKTSNSIVSVLKSIRKVLIEIRNILKKSLAFKKKLIRSELISFKKGKSEEKERKMESKPGWFSGVGEALSNVQVPFFDRIKQYFSAILIGSLVLFLVKKAKEIIDVIRSFFETLKKIWQAFEPFIRPLWDGFKWIVKEGVEFVAKIMGVPSQEAD